MESTIVDPSTITVADILSYLRQQRNHGRRVKHLWQLHDFDNLYCTITHTGDIYDALLNFNERNEGVLECELDCLQASLPEYQDEMKYYKKALAEGTVPQSEKSYVLYNLDTLEEVCELIFREMLSVASETYIIVREDRGEKCGEDCPFLCKLYTRYKLTSKFTKYPIPNMANSSSDDDNDDIYESQEDEEEEDDID